MSWWRSGDRWGQGTMGFLFSFCIRWYQGTWPLAISRPLHRLPWIRNSRGGDLTPIRLYYVYVTNFQPIDSGSQKVQHRFGGFKHKSETISITRMVQSENSSDLERVPGTRSIAAEFSECTILDIELQRCENTAFHFHTAPFGNRSPRTLPISDVYYI